MKDKHTNEISHRPEEEKRTAREDAVKYGIEPTDGDDVVLGAEIGGVGGAVTGAIAGSALGVPGAVTGAVIGGVLGAAGSAAAVAAVDKVDDDSSPVGAGLDLDRDEVSENPDAVRTAIPHDPTVPILPTDEKEPVHPEDPPVEVEPDRNLEGQPHTPPEAPDAYINDPMRRPE
jgi:hypothetical protein